MVLSNLLIGVKNEFVRALLIVIIGFASAQLVSYFLNTAIKGIIKKTQNKIDDLVLEIITTPIYYLIVFSGLYLALKSLESLSKYNGSFDNFFLVLLISFVAIVFARISDILVNNWLKGKDRKTPKLVNKIVNLSIYLIAILMILQVFNVEITPLLATLGLGALALGLALQPTLANFFAGIRLISDKPIRVGDYIELDNLSGFVEDIGWNTTRIKTLPGNMVVIPNSKIADSILINNSLPNRETGVLVNCGVSFNSNLSKVEKVTLDVAQQIQKKIPGAVKTFKPLMRFKKFGSSNIEFFVVLRSETYFDKYLITSEFIKALKSRFDKEKIEISWPVRRIYTSKPFS